MSDVQSTGSSDCIDNSEKQHIAILKAEKKRLEKDLEEKKSQLRKLNLVKLYRVKNDLSDLDALICKWREASQEAIEELFQTVVNKDHDISMGDFLASMNIDVNLIKYDEESESFLT